MIVKIVGETTVTVIKQNNVHYYYYDVMRKIVYTRLVLPSSIGMVTASGDELPRL